MRAGLAAAASFILGVFITLLARGDFQRPLLAQGRPDWSVPVVYPLGIAVPRVRPLPEMIREGNITSAAGGSRITLDGLDSLREAYGSKDGTTFVYGGGAYRLRDTVIDGPIALELVGAAANTALLLQQFGIIPSETPLGTRIKVNANDKNKPVTKTKILPRPLRGDMEAQWDGAKQ